MSIDFGLHGLKDDILRNNELLHSSLINFELHGPNF